MVKSILFFLFSFIAIYALDSINITNVFKKNRYYASRVLYMMISISLSYMVVNFLYDIVVYSTM